MSKFTFHCPINGVSFGQVSVALLRQAYRKKFLTSIFPIGALDMSSQAEDKKFDQWMSDSMNVANCLHNRKKDGSLKLWHISGGNETFSAQKSVLMTFHETNELTPSEINILSGMDAVIVTSSFTQKIFQNYGLGNVFFVPLGFDSDNFSSIDRNRLKIDGITSFLITGKAEKRKATYKTIGLWAKRYGNNKNFRLNCAVTNTHLKPEDQNVLLHNALEGKTYWNINFIQQTPLNRDYNTILQSSDIIISCSGGEGFNLPLYHATALGSWPVALNAHVHKDYLTDKNAVLIEPKGLIPAYDGIFFREGAKFNQGHFYDFSAEDFYAACETAVAKVRSVGINTEGMKLQERNYSPVFDEIGSILQSNLPSF